MLLFVKLWNLHRHMHEQSSTAHFANLLKAAKIKKNYIPDIITPADEKGWTLSYSRWK